MDATCPNVKRIHQIVSQAEEQGRQPVIVGTPDHPEVVPSPVGATVRWYFLGWKI